MFRVNVETPAANLIAGALRSGGARLSAERADAVGARAVIIGRQIAEKELRTRVPDRRGDRKGQIHYKNAFTTRRSTSSFPIRSNFGNNSDIAGIVENGSVPHVIQGQPLLFIPGRKGDPGLPSSFGRKTGTVVKSVNHPGTPPRKIVERALLQALREQGIRVRGTT